MNLREILTNSEESSDESKITTRFRHSKTHEKRRRKSRRRVKAPGKVEMILSEAYQMYANRDYAMCMEKLEEAVKLSSKNPIVYQTMAIILEEQDEIEKSFYFYVIAANLKKVDIFLWKKLYFMTHNLGLLGERVDFLTEIQKFEDSKDIVMEKIEIFESLGQSHKVLGARIELMKFQGFDNSLIEDICKEVKESTQLKKILKKLIIAALAIRLYFRDIHMIIYICFKARYLEPLPALFERVIFNLFESLPIEYELIYLISKISTTNDIPCINKLLERIDNATVRDNIFLVLFLYDELFSKGRTNECMKIMRLLHKNRKYFDSSGGTAAEFDSNIENNELMLFNSCKDNSLSSIITKNENILISKLSCELVVRSNIYMRKHRVWNFMNEYKIRYAPLLVQLSRKEEGLRLYLEIYNENPLDYIIKQTISDLYSQLGAVDLAKQYMIRYESINIIDDLVDVDKTMFRYSIEECAKNKQMYETIARYNPLKLENISIDNLKLQYLPLVKDCKNNPFMFKINRRFKNLLTEDERLRSCSENRTEIKKDRTRLRLMSLHGLTIEEWFVILKGYCLACFITHDWTEFKSLIEACISSHVVRHNSYFHMYFAFLGIRYAVQESNLSFLINCVKRLEYNASNKFIQFIYFFSNFIESPTRIADFMCFQRNFQRFYFLRMKKKVEDVEEIDDHKIEHLDYATDFYKYLNGCLPSFLYSSTLTKICYLAEYHKKYFESEIILASIFLCQSLSRRVSNRKYFIDRGFSILHNLESKSTNLEDKCAVWYNIGRGYHQFNILGMADMFYRKVLVTSNSDLKRLALFNLMLIYKSNGSKTLYKSMMNQFRNIEE